MNKIRYLKLCILLIFTMLWHSYEIFAVNNNETIINANIKYKQNLDLNKYGGQDFADKHIKETSKNKQIELMKNRAEVKKRIDAVADLLKESKQYDMAYTFGGNHAENTANTISGIKNGMDCSSWMAYVFQMHGLSCNPKTNTAAGWHTKFKRLVEISKRTDRPIRMHTGVNETENGWIYTFSYGSDPAIKHIGISIGNQLCHARGAPDPKKWKTIDITNVIKRSGGATFSMADILEFCAYYPELAKQAGFELTNMMSPEQVRSEWSQVKKGHAGGQFPEGTVEENGDAGLSLAYNLFHLEFNFDEWFAYPIFEKISKIIDYTLAISMAVVGLFVIFRIVYQILVLTLKGQDNLGTILFNTLETVFSALLLIGILALYKDIVYKPFIDFATNGFVDSAFGEQINSFTSSTLGSVPKGSLNGIYYMSITPLARIVDLWQESLDAFSEFSSWTYTITNLGALLALTLQSVLFFLLAVMTIYIGLRFVISIFVAQIMLIITLAFGAVLIALSYIPKLESYMINPLKALITIIAKIIPTYVMLIVWVNFVDKILEMETLPTSLVILIYFAIFMLGAIAFQIIRLMIKLMTSVITKMLSSMGEAAEAAENIR